MACGVARGGVEPPTYRFSGGRSYQLSYLAVTRAARVQAVARRDDTLQSRMESVSARPKPLPDLSETLSGG